MTKDATIVIKGDLAAVFKVEITRGPTGIFKCVVHGVSKTSEGKDIGLDAAIVDMPSNNQILNAVWDAALPLARQANGLE